MWKQVGRSNVARREGRDRGVSLILVLLSMVVLSVLAATIVFTARSETLASYNFKLDTQADYLAKAGVQQALNWLRSSRYQAVTHAQASTYYTVTATGNPYNYWTSNAAPVKCISGCSVTSGSNNTVQFRSIPGTGSTNYPFSGVVTNFNADFPSGGIRVTGDANNSGLLFVDIVLLNYQTVGVGTPPAVSAAPVETWLITSRAQWTGTSGSTSTVAMAEERAAVQPIYLPTWGNALYGYCSVAMAGSSGVCTDAFNSAFGAYAAGNVTVAAKGCDDPSAPNVIDMGAGVGANGGVSLSSNVVVAGNVTIGTGPPTGCGAKGYSGSTSSILGSVVSGPHIEPPPVPTFPSGFPTGAPNVDSGTNPQTAAGGTPPAGTTITPGAGNTYTKPCTTGFTCNGSAANPYLISELSGSVTLVGGADVFHPVYYDIDSISLTGNNGITVTGYVIWNVKTTIDIHGNGVANTLTNAPESCQINFAGTSGAIGGNGAMSAIVIAPEADIAMKGGGSKGYMVGSVQAKNIDFQGGYPLHYDIQLNRAGGQLGVIVTTGYSRKKM